MSILDKIFNNDYLSDKTKKDENDWLDQLISEVSSSILTSGKRDTNYDKEIEISDNSVIDDLFEGDFIPNIDSYNSTENKLNTLRSKTLNNKYTSEFISLLRDEDFEFGYTTRSEKLILNQLQINALATRNWINEIFIKHFSDEVIIIGILRILGRFEPNQIFPQGQTIALAALNHENDEIKELGVRAFEKWCSIESLNILKKLQVNTPWLNEYITDVIKDFEEQLCLY